MKVVLNIGLKNNPLNYDRVSDLLTVAFPSMHYKVVAFRNGKYDGTVEPTMVAELSIGGSVSRLDVLNQVQSMTEVMTLVCIAVKITSVVTTCHLIYNPQFIGKKQAFNNDYFLQI